MVPRLATKDDIPALQKMLEDVGQLRSEQALAENIGNAKEVVMVLEEAGELRAFWFSRDIGSNTVLWAPIGGPIADKAEWWRAAVILGKASAEEGERRWPAMNLDKRRVLVKLWPGQEAIMASLETLFKLTPADWTDDVAGVRTYQLDRKAMLKEANTLSISL